MAKVTSPIKGYNETTVIGHHTLVFRDSVAEINGPLNEGELSYMQSAGYTVSGIKRDKEGKLEQVDANVEAIASGDGVITVPPAPATEDEASEEELREAALRQKAEDAGVDADAVIERKASKDEEEAAMAAPARRKRKA